MKSIDHPDIDWLTDPLKKYRPVCTLNPDAVISDEVAYKAIKGYLKRKDKDVSKLCDYARKMRKPLDKIVAALLADE